MSLKIQRFFSRAEKLKKKGEFDKAKEIYLSILEISPKNQMAMNELKAIHGFESTRNAKDKLDEVMKLYSSGLIEDSLALVLPLQKDNPNEPILFNITGACYSEIGSINLAIDNFQRAVNLKPDYAEAHYNLGVVLQKNGEDEEAYKSYEKAIAIKHAYPQAHNNIGMINLKNRNLNEAVKSFEWAVAYNPNYVEAHNNLGATFQELMQFQKAMYQYEKALSINPKFAQALNNLGASLEIFGQREKAFENYNKAIQENPRYYEAHRNLSAIKKYKKNDPQIHQLEALYSNINLTKPDKKNLSFALAKVYEDLGENEKFFKFLNEGNNLRKQELNYSFESSNNFHLSLLRAFKSPPKIISQNEKNKSTIRPIFVLGMPRSGTTLVEQIISSHHEVYGAGELNNLKKFVTPIFLNHANSNNKVISDKDILSLRNNYLDSLSELNFKEKIMTDKMPINFRLIGFFYRPSQKLRLYMLKEMLELLAGQTINIISVLEMDLLLIRKIYQNSMAYIKKLWIFGINYSRIKFMI